MIYGEAFSYLPLTAEPFDLAPTDSMSLEFRLRTSDHSLRIADRPGTLPDVQRLGVAFRIVLTWAQANRPEVPEASRAK
jgi:hypothetical protein